MNLLLFLVYLHYYEIIGARKTLAYIETTKMKLFFVEIMGILIDLTMSTILHNGIINIFRSNIYVKCTETQGLS